MVGEADVGSVLTLFRALSDPVLLSRRALCYGVRSIVSKMSASVSCCQAGIWSQSAT